MSDEAKAILAERSADVEKIQGQLRQVVAKSGEASYLVVAVGDAYVQYISSGPGSLGVEATSNDNLPAGKQISVEQVAELMALGFEEPEEEGFNYAMDRSPKGDGDFAELAMIGILALFAIYRCPRDATLEYELSLD